MESDYDIPLEDYDTPYVTIDEMKEMLGSRKHKWDDDHYEELQFDEQSGLYYTECFAYHDRDLLQAHLLVEQCLEHFDELDWERITNGYELSVVSRIEHLMENPLVWVDEMPDELAEKFVVTGRVAVEKSSEERSTCLPYCDFFVTMRKERLKWFANQLPTPKDIYPDYSYHNVPKDMILWGVILTDDFEFRLWEINDFEKKDRLMDREYWPYCNPQHFRRELERIYDQFGAQKAALIVRLLREDWQDIKVLKLFGIDTLTLEQIEEFQQCLFEGMDRNLRRWDAETPQPSSPETTPASFEYITDQCRKEGKAEAVEAELRAAAKGTAVAMWKTIRTNEALGYLSTKNLAASKIYKALTAYFGPLPYNERNFRDARNKR